MESCLSFCTFRTHSDLNLILQEKKKKKKKKRKKKRKEKKKKIFVGIIYNSRKPKRPTVRSLRHS